MSNQVTYPSIFKRSCCSILIAVCFILYAIIPVDSFAQSKNIMGFTAENAKKQFELEKKFDSMITPANMDAWMKKMSARPHHLGSPYDKEMIDFAASKFTEWGFETKLETFWVLFPTPKKRVLELVAPTKYKAKLKEKAIKSDPPTGQTKEMLPPYNAFSADGDVTAEVVFVNYGIPSDYEELAKRGIDVKGKIVIAKYGGSWRGIKPKVAAEKGAIGCLIYSDPKDDGYIRGDAYPKGAYKNETGVQRGSVVDMPLYPGDPLTPGVGAVKDAKRLERKDAKSLMTIPVLPISWGDALPILKALEGPVAPASWAGGLPITYHMGPGPAKVHLNLEFNWDIVPAYNVIATMKGSEFPDELVIRGNHIDAWVHGASDPLSGMVALMEEARAVGELVKAGHKPKRTMIYAAWDAEEEGIIGSTEWAEYHQDRLKDKAVVYINTDGSGRGYLGAGGSHSLEKFFNEIAHEVLDPETGLTAANRVQARAMANGSKEAAKSSYFKLSALGSGSDYTPFIQHLGIASLNIGYGGEGGAGVYHTAYDTYSHFKRFGDSDFAYGAALAKTAGRAAMRFANADVLQFEFSQLNNTINDYLTQIKNMADKMHVETEEFNEMVQSGVFESINDPKNPLKLPKEKLNVPHFNFSLIDNAIHYLNLAAEECKERIGNSIGKLSKTELVKLNKLLYTSERKLTRPEGLPRREWFKHFIYAPGFYTGYGVKTIPGVREAIEERNWNEADEQIVKAAEVLEAITAHINKIISLLEG